MKVLQSNKNKYILIFSFILIISIIFGYVFIINKAKNKNNEFNFILRYGVQQKVNIFKFSYLEEPKNILDTFKHTYTKDLLEAGTVTTKLEFTKEDMKQVMDFMIKEDVLNYPEEFKGFVRTYPTVVFKLKIFYNGKEKSIKWAYLPLERMLNKVINDDEEKLEQYKNLLKLGQMVMDIIHSKNEYRELPPEKGGYL